MMSEMTADCCVSSVKAGCLGFCNGVYRPRIMLLLFANLFQPTVNSLNCGHPWDQELMSLIARVFNSGNLFQSNDCNLFFPVI